MEEDVIDQIMQIKQIKGLIQTDTEGEDVASTIEDEQLAHFMRSGRRYFDPAYRFYSGGSDC